MPWCPRAAHPARLPGNQPCPRGKPTPRRQKSRPLVKSSGNGNGLLLPHCRAKTLHNQSSGTIFLPPACRKSQMQVRPRHCQRTLLQMGQAISCWFKPWAGMLEAELNSQAGGAANPKVWKNSLQSGCVPVCWGCWLGRGRRSSPEPTPI